MKTSVPMILLAALCACGPQSLVTDGTYDSDSSAALANASLVVDVSAKTASSMRVGLQCSRKSRRTTANTVWTWASADRPAGGVVSSGAAKRATRSWAAKKLPSSVARSA